MGMLNLSTTWGIISITFCDKGITSLNLPGEALLDMGGDSPASFAGGMENAENASSLLKEYFSGRHVDFSTVKVDLSTHTPFFRDICRVAQSIPYGELRTYGELAAMIGRKGAARAVGRVMAANPLPIIIPCHRVVSSDGTLTGYSASGGLKTKKRLLEMEGVSFDQKGRVVSCKKSPSTGGRD